MSYYVVFNLLLEDRVKILTSQWRLGTNPILVRQWVLNFSATKAIGDAISVIWVRLPFLPLVHHCPQALIPIGNKIGCVVALEARHTNNLQVNAARICIECDVGSELPKEISINGNPQQLIYENLHFFTGFSLLSKPSAIPLPKPIYQLGYCCSN